MAVESSVRQATSADHERMAAALAAAFSEDPVFSWLLPPGAPSRERRMLTLFRALVRSYLPKDSCYLAGDVDAVAMWAPPGKWETPMGDIFTQLGPFLGSLRFRAIHSLRTLLSVEGAHPKEPVHWYLGFLGTVPAHQGQGLGAQLLQEVLVDADRAGLPAYLESSNPRNLTLYRRHGFEVVEEMRPPWGCPPIWRMWREPRRGA
jgi:ribosomal protein S18 acetylase RimI-like enzyme